MLSDVATASFPSSGPKVFFEVWLDRGIHEIYAGILDEPVPESLLKLIRSSGL